MIRKEKTVHKYIRFKLILVYFAIVGIFLCVLIRLYYVGGKQMEADYNEGKIYYGKGNYEEAKTIFDNLGEYKDARNFLRKCEYYMALDELEQRYEIIDKIIDKAKIKDLDTLITDINSLELEYDNIDNDAGTRIKGLKERVTYSLAVALYSEKDYEDALKHFQDVKDYSNSSYYIAQITILLYPDAQKVLYESAQKYFASGDYQNALKAYEELVDYKDSLNKGNICRRFLLSNTVSAGISGTVYLDSTRKIERKGVILGAIKSFDEYKNLISVSAKDTVLVALDENGQAYICGADLMEEETKVFNSFDDAIQVVSGELYAVVLSADGRVYAAGHGGDGQKDINDTWQDYTIKEVACGWRTTVGLRDDGKVLVEGYRKEKLEAELQDKSKEWINIIHISAGGGGSVGKGHILALREDNTVVAVGDNTQGQCNVSEWNGVIAISAGDFHSLGLRFDGDVYITTPEGYELKSFPEKIVSISAGYGYSIFVGESGKAYTEENGYNKQGQVDDIENWRIYLM